MPALATTPQQTQALMTDFLKSSTTSGRSGKKSKSRQSLASAANQTLPSPVQPQYAFPQPPYYTATAYDEFANQPIQVYHPHPYMIPQRPIPYPYNSPGQVEAYGPPMEPSLSNESIMSMQQSMYQQPPVAQLDPALDVPEPKPKRAYTKKAASWKENGGAGRGRNKGKAPATAVVAEPLTASSGSGSASGSGSVISDQFSPVLEQPPLAQPTKRRPVPVTNAGPEGRKLNLASPTDESLEGSASLDSSVDTLEPRLTTIPSIQTDGHGVASLATADIVCSEMSWLESARSIPLPSTPGGPGPVSPVSESKAVKTKRRLEAFSIDPSSSTSPTKKSRSPNSSGSALISTRVEMFGRVALGKEAAVRWLGLEGTAAAVEETQLNQDAAEEAWVQSQSSSSSPRLIRPDWPDAHGPWAAASAEQLDFAKETAERKQLLTKYLETESEEDEEHTGYVHGRTLSSGRGKTAHDLVHRSPSPSPRGLHRLAADSADARSAFLLAHRNRPIRSVGPFIACMCGSKDDAPPLQSCEGCNSFHHAECVALEAGETFMCRPCERKAIHASGGLATPPPSSEPRLVATADPTRIYRSDLQSLALAPSPMFGGERRTPGQFRTPRIPSSAARNSTPGSPSSAQRSRILSYGEDEYTPSTPAARNVSNGSHHQPSTPRFEDLLNAQDDHPFDVTSTPSRHLDFTPAQQFLFQTPTGHRARVVSSTGQPMAFATPSQDFLKELHNESTPALSHLASADSMAYPLSPYTASGSASIARLPSSLLTNQQHSPSPYGHRRRVSSGNKVSFAPASSSVRLSSRLGFGAAFDEEDELEGQSVGKGYQGGSVGSLEGSSMR